MKYIFRLMLALSISAANARDVILIENLSSPEAGQILMRLLQDKFNIPRTLITYKAVKKCQSHSDALMQLCLKAPGELEIVRMNRFVVENTLRVFTEAEEK